MAKIPTQFANNAALRQPPAAENVRLSQLPGGPDIAGFGNRLGQALEKVARSESTEDVYNSKMHLAAARRARNDFMSGLRQSKADPSSFVGDFRTFIDGAKQYFPGNDDGYAAFAAESATTEAGLQRDVETIQGGMLVETAIEELLEAGDNYVAGTLPSIGQINNHLLEFQTDVMSTFRFGQQPDVLRRVIESNSPRLVRNAVDAHIRNGVPIDWLGNPELVAFIGGDKLDPIKASYERNVSRSATNGSKRLGSDLSTLGNGGLVGADLADSLIEATQAAPYGGFARTHPQLLNAAGSPQKVLLTYARSRLDRSIKNARGDGIITDAELNDLQENKKLADRLIETYGDPTKQPFPLFNSEFLGDSLSDLRSRAIELDQAIREYDDQVSVTGREVYGHLEDLPGLKAGDRPLSLRAAREMFSLENNGEDVAFAAFEGALRSEDGDYATVGARSLFTGLVSFDRQSLDRLEKVVDTMKTVAREKGVEANDLLPRFRGELDLASTLMLQSLLRSPNSTFILQDITSSQDRHQDYSRAVKIAAAKTRSDVELENSLTSLGLNTRQLIEDKDLKGPDGRTLRSSEDTKLLSFDFEIQRINSDGGAGQSQLVSIRSLEAREIIEQLFAENLYLTSQSTAIDSDVLRQAIEQTRSQFASTYVRGIEVETSRIGADSNEPLLIGKNSIFRDDRGQIDENLVSLLAKKINSGDGTPGSSPFGTSMIQDFSFGQPLRADFNGMKVQAERDPNRTSETFYIPVFPDAGEDFTSTTHLKVTVDLMKVGDARITVKHEDITSAPRGFVPIGDEMNTFTSQRLFAWQPSMGPDAALQDYPDRFNAYVNIARQQFPDASEGLLLDAILEMATEDGWPHIESQNK